MTQSLRLLGALLAAIFTTLYIMLFSPLLNASLPFLTGFLLPLFAATLGLIVLSYVFVALATAGGAVAPGPFMNGLAALYVVLCTPLLVWAVLTAFNFAIAFAPLFLIGIGAFVVFLLLPAVMALVTYVLAATFAPIAGGIETPGECFFRGALIGANTAFNGVFAAILYPLAFAPLIAGSAAIGWVVPLIVILLVLATFMTVLASVTLASPPGAATLQTLVEGFAGWLSWLMPMSWTYCVYGWWQFYLSWAGHLLLLLSPASFPGGWAITGLRLSAEGDMAMDGGIGGAASASAYNSGCFTFVAPASAGQLAVRQHETGHHLHLAAFGSFFHLIDGINENGYAGIAGQGANAYGERVAESNVVPSQGRREVQVWR